MVTAEEQNLINGLHNKAELAEAERIRMSKAAISMFHDNQDPNLVQFQLDLDNILDKIYHLLRGDKIEYDAQGNLDFVEQDDPELQLFNEKGVQLIMGILAFVVNRNTILSNYDIETINQRLFDLGWEIGDQIYTQSESIGLDTPEKEKRYPIIILQILCAIESVYRRALGGKENDNLRSQYLVNQTQPLSQSGSPYPIMPQKRSWNPFKWGRG